MKVAKTVVFCGLLLACARPAKEHAVSSGSGAAPSAPTLAATGSGPSSGGGTVAVPVAPSAAPASSVSGPRPVPMPSAAASPTNSAYFGCGQGIPPEHLWDETTDAEVLDAISAAKACAASQGRRLLLEFVAPWCADCQQMAKLDETAVVAATLKRRFERVRINVGKWDRHEALRANFEVRALATYIIIDPKTSKLLAKTTLEPVTKRGPKLTAEDWARWLEAH